MPGAAHVDEEVGAYAPLTSRAPDNAPRDTRKPHHAIVAAALVVGALVVGAAVSAAAGRASHTATPPTTTTTNPPNIPPECVTALGGSVMGPGGSVKMVAGRASADGGASCRSALAAYAAQPGGAYWRDVEAAVGAAYAALGISSAEEDEGAVMAGKKPRGVVVFDIDETALSNAPLSSDSAAAAAAAAPSPSPFPTALFAADGARLPSSSSSARDDAPSPALVPTLRLYNALQRQGLAAAFVTGRGEAARAATEKSLLAAGYGGRCGGGGDKGKMGDSGGAPCYLSLTLRQPGDARPASVYKPEARRALAAATGLPVVASVGDQWSDLSGEEGQRGAAEGRAATGAEDTTPYVAIKLPNPFYYIL